MGCGCGRSKEEREAEIQARLAARAAAREARRAQIVARGGTVPAKNQRRR